MIITDTSVWIDFLRRKEPVFSQMKKLLEHREITVLEPIFGELLQGLRDAEEKEIILGYWTNLPKHLTENVWIQAGIFSSENKLYTKGVGLIDAYILCAARWGGRKVWTLDKKMKALLEPKEIYLP